MLPTRSRSFHVRLAELITITVLAATCVVFSTDPAYAGKAEGTTQTAPENSGLDHPQNQKRKYTGEKPFKCDDPKCEYATALVGRLKTHKLTHTGEKPFKCDHSGCDYATTTSSALRVHKLRHTGEKPFKCDYSNCDYATIIPGSLKLHERRHTGEKPLQCDYPDCDYAAARLGNLKAHKLSHAGEKPFKCNHSRCDFATVSADHLKTHKLSHQREKPFKCNYPGCGYSATLAGNLKRHKLTHTGENQVDSDITKKRRSECVSRDGSWHEAKRRKVGDPIYGFGAPLFADVVMNEEDEPFLVATGFDITSSYLGEHELVSSDERLLSDVSGWEGVFSFREDLGSCDVSEYVFDDKMKVEHSVQIHAVPLKEHRSLTTHQR